MVIAFIDQMRSKGAAVESICRVLREQGCQIAARTYRAWRSRRPVARTVTDAQAADAVREIAWRVDHHGRRRMTPEGLYGRVKMRAYLDRTTMPGVSYGAVDRAMKTLGSTMFDGQRESAPPSRSRTESAPVICSTASSVPRNPTGCGSPISHMSERGPGGRTRCSSSTCSRGGSWPGVFLQNSARRRTQRHHINGQGDRGLT